MQKQVLTSILLALLIISSSSLAICSQTISVPLGEPTTFTLTLNQNDYVSGSIVVTGGLTSDVNFYITDPGSNNVVSYSQITQTSFSFSAETTGVYTLFFQNTGLLTKNVTLDYNVKASILGLPQDTFIILVVAAILAVIIVVSIVILAIRRSKGSNKVS